MTSLWQRQLGKGSEKPERSSAEINARAFEAPQRSKRDEPNGGDLAQALARIVSWGSSYSIFISSSFAPFPDETDLMR